MARFDEADPPFPPGNIDADEIDQLTAFLDGQEHAKLVEVLLEQAVNSEAVLQRLRHWRMAGQPARLATALGDWLARLVLEAEDVTWTDADGFANEIRMITSNTPTTMARSVA